MAVEPGEQVYVVPFHKRATLIRILADKDLAVVQSGIFEMQVPLIDLEPLQSPPADKGKGPPRQGDKGGKKNRQNETETPQEHKHPTNETEPDAPPNGQAAQ